MIIENVFLGRKQVLKIIQNGYVVWEHDNRLPLGSGVIETFTFENVRLDALTSYIMRSSMSGESISSEQAKLSTIIMQTMWTDTSVSESVSSEQANLNTIIMQPLRTDTSVSEANTSEQANLTTIVIYGMPGEGHSESITDVDLLKAPSANLTIQFMSGYTRDVKLTDVFAEKLYTLCTSLANPDATLQKSEAGGLASDVYTKSATDADLLKSESGVLDFGEDISTIYELRLNRPFADLLSSARLSHCSKQVALARPSANRLDAGIDAETTTDATMKSPKSDAMVAERKVESVTTAEVKVDGTRKLGGLSLIGSKHDSALHKTIQSNIEYAKTVFSKILATMDWLQGNEHHRYLDAFVEALSSHYSELMLGKPFAMGKHASDIYSSSTGLLDFVAKLLLGEALEITNSSSSGLVEMTHGAALGIDEIAKTNPHALVEIYRTAVLGEFRELLKTEHSAAVDIYRARFISEFSELLESKHRGAVEVCRSIALTESISALESAHEVAFEKVRPAELAALAKSLANTSSTSIDIPQTFRVVGSDKIYSSSTGEMATSHPKYIGTARSTMRTIYYATLVLEGNWLDPIQRGSDLYIRQTYEDPLQEGTNLDISEVYFPPVQDGTNLYIISAQSLGGEYDG